MRDLEVCDLKAAGIFYAPLAAFRRASAYLGLTVFLATLAGVGCGRATPNAHYPADWNRQQLDWRPYGLGLRDAKQVGKPIMVVFYTDWCPHCHNYSRVFHDPRLVAASRDFIMIRVERDANRELSQKYDLDGDYIPRTLLLTPEGDVLTELQADRSDYRYFLDEYSAEETLELMQRALALVKRRAGHP